jgi:transposase
MVHLLREDRLLLARLAEREGVSFSAVYRWVKRGVNGVHLESFMVGHRRFTTEQAFVRFVSRLNRRDVDAEGVLAGGAA